MLSPLIWCERPFEAFGDIRWELKSNQFQSCRNKYSRMFIIWCLISVLSWGSSVGFQDAKLKIMEQSDVQLRDDILMHGRAAGQMKHRVAFARKQLNISKLTEILHLVSDPQSDSYGDHLSRQEVVELTSSPESFQSIINFLNNKDIYSISSSKYGDFVFADASVSQWEDIFGTEFFEFEHKAKAGSKFVRSFQYSLPECLWDHVDAVFNTVQFPTPHMGEDGAVHDMLATGYTTPFLLNHLYNIKNNTGNNLTSQAIYGNLHQAVSPLDLSMFQTAFNLPQYGISESQGGHVRDDACAGSISNCMEANLDVQYIMAIAQNTPTVYYYWTGDDVWLDWVTTVSSLDDPPDVFSISYGSYEFFMSPAYLNAFNVEAIKLGVMGTTLLAASGDDGVAGFAARILGPAFCDYQPMFPASSPYVTAVGGTMGPEQGLPEVACQSDRGGQITTGGGFSHTFPLPPWQADAVRRYLQRLRPDDQQVESAGGTGYPWEQSGAPGSGVPTGRRGYPDISALANRYIVAANGMFFQVSGTSASCPVVAGMVALVNAARRAQGNSTLGWLNPALYGLYPAFANDITSGDNRCLAGNIMGPRCCKQGFSAAPGWDPVTGLGTIDFERFKDTLMDANKFGAGRKQSDNAAPVPFKASPDSAPTAAEQPLESTGGAKVTVLVPAWNVALLWLAVGWLLSTSAVVLVVLVYKSMFRWNYASLP